MSFLFPIFNRPKPRGFRHEPIYYDQQKEEREERYERIRKELNMTPEEDKKPQSHDFEKDIRGSFRQAVPGGSNREKVAKANRITFIVCVVLILVVLYVYLRLGAKA